MASPIYKYMQDEQVEEHLPTEQTDVTVLEWDLDVSVCRMK